MMPTGFSETRGWLIWSNVYQGWLRQKNGEGYTSLFHLAGTFSENEARGIVKERARDRAVGTAPAAVAIQIIQIADF